MAVDKRWSKNRVPHRTLYTGSRGLDVAQFQHALNRRAKARSEFGYKPITPDGDFGPATRKLWVAMAKAVGLDHRRCTVGNQILMRSPGRRSPAQVKKAAHWLARARAKLRAGRVSGSGGAKAVAFMVKRAGSTESPAGSNDSAFLRHWRDALGMAWMRGQPWCGFAVLAAYHYGAHKALPQGVVFTPNIVAWAHAGDHFQAVPSSQAKAGDLVVFNFPGGHPVADHVGLARGPARGGVIPTVEGNTSSGNGGSQSNGGGIFIRSRPVGLIAVVARPK
jgi:hypothetical protein